MTRLALLVSPLMAVEALVAVLVAAAVAFAPAEPEPVATPVVALCRPGDVLCPQVTDETRARMKELEE